MGLSWLGELIALLGSLIPRFYHLNCTKVAVTITRGKHVKALSPGLIFFWPFWTNLFYRIANVQTINLPSKAIITKDMKTVVVGGVIRYRVTDAIKAIIDTYDVDESIVDEALAAVCAFVADRTLSEVQYCRCEAYENLTQSVRAAVERYGVYVERAQLTDFSPCVVLHHTGAKNDQA